MGRVFANEGREQEVDACVFLEEREGGLKRLEYFRHSVRSPLRLALVFAWSTFRTRRIIRTWRV